MVYMPTTSVNSALPPVSVRCVTYPNFDLFKSQTTQLRLSNPNSFRCCVKHQRSSMWYHLEFFIPTVSYKYTTNNLFELQLYFELCFELGINEVNISQI